MKSVAQIYGKDNSKDDVSKNFTKSFPICTKRFTVVLAQIAYMLIQVNRVGLSTLM